MFLSDELGRVLANLSIPRSLLEVGRQVAADAHAPFDKTASFSVTANAVAAILAELETAGYAKRLGVFDNASDVVTAVDADPDVPDLPTEKATQFVDRLSGRDAWKLAEGELWYFTDAGLVALTS